MAQVKVWNDNDYDYKEKFKDKDIFIPAKQFVEMEYYEAHEFKGAFKAIQRDGDNQPMPQSFKKIRVEEAQAADVDAKIESNKCVACAYRGGSAKDLFDHTLAIHAEQFATDEVAETANKSKKKAS